MSVPRVYVADRLDEGAGVCIRGESARHLLKVLRLEAGDRLIVFNGEGGEYRGVIEGVSRDAVDVRLDAFVDPARESPLGVTLAQGISRGERMDFAIQKAVELGVSAIVPIMTERSVVRLEGARRARRLDHWRKVALHACQQCGRTRLPRLEEVVALDPWLADGLPEPARGLMLEPGAGRGLDSLEAAPRQVVLLIGPEGGLSDAEQARARRAGFEPLALGPRILRTETAALAALTALQLKWGDLSGPGAGTQGPRRPA